MTSAPDVFNAQRVLNEDEAKIALALFKPLDSSATFSERRTPDQVPAAPLRLLEPNELAEAGASITRDLPLDLIDPSPVNPRRALQDVEALAESIKDHGLLQPILVRRKDDRYEVLAGHRRRAAFLLLAEREPFEPRWKTVPAVVRTADDAAARLMLITAQIQILNWTSREEARILEELAVDYTIMQIGELVHRSFKWVSNRLRVYADDILSVLVQTGRLTATVAEELLLVRDPEQRRQYAQRAVDEAWSPLQARHQVRKLRKDKALAELNRLVTEVLDLLSGVDASTIPIGDFRNLMVLRGRLDILGQQARGEPAGPKFPPLPQVREVKSRKPDQKRRRTKIRVD